MLREQRNVFKNKHGTGVIVSRAICHKDLLRLEEAVTKTRMLRKNGRRNVFSRCWLRFQGRKDSTTKQHSHSSRQEY